MIESTSRTLATSEMLPGILREDGYELPDDLSFERWASILTALQQIDRSVKWWLGDALVYGEQHFPKQHSQLYPDRADDPNGIKQTTMKQAAWVSSKFPPVTRVTELSWTHHRAVAELPPDDAHDLLDAALHERLSTRELDERVKERQLVIRRRALAALPIPASLPARVELHAGDAASLPLDAASVDVIITSPPYALDKSYTNGDVAARTWQQHLEVWMREARRVARPAARLALNVPLDTTLGGFRPTYAQAVAATQRAGWTYRTTVVWIDDQLGKSTARGSVDSATSPHVIAPAEMIILASNGPWLRVEPVDAPSDLDHDDWLSWTHGIWRFPGESNAWEHHPAPFPVELPRRLLYLLSFPDDVILDPFVGSGTTAVAAVAAGRQFIGVDSSPEYLASTRRRLAKGAH